MQWFKIILIPLIILPIVIGYLYLQHQEIFESQIKQIYKKILLTEQKYFNGNLILIINRISKWMIPALYFGLFVYMTFTFYTKIHYKIEKPNTFLYNFLLLALFINFVLSISIKPKIVNKNTHLKYHYNNLIFFKDKECSTCHLIKPARSKHCKYCRNCIELYDHHCIWLNNCVGKGNYLIFYSFLVLNILVLTYGCFIIYPIIKKYWDSDSWLNWNSVRYELGIFVLCFSFNLLLIWFLFENIRNIKRGMTTNELTKWEYVQDVLNLGNLYYYNGNYYEFLNNGKVFVSIDLSNDKVQHVDPTLLVNIKSMNELNNIYDSGSFWRNLAERL